MRYLLLLTLPLALSAQSAESDRRVTQTLISEIQQLRLAIERSTLLNARTQLATSQLQMQEQSVARAGAQLNEVRGQAPGTNGHKARVAGQLEYWQGHPLPDTETWQAKLKELKVELEQATAAEQNRASRESELTVQLQTAQNQIAASRARIDEMERALDAEIRQMLKK